MSAAALKKLHERFAESIVDTHCMHGDETAIIERSRLHEAISFLKDNADLDFDMLTDLTAVDYLEQLRAGKRDSAKKRFEVVYHLYSLSKGHRIRIKVCLDEPSAEEVDTISDLYKNADWCEREVWDLYGIKFSNHPNLKRILLDDGFVGHPLRKDYPKDKRQPLVRRPKEEIEAILPRKNKA